MTRQSRLFPCQRKDCPLSAVWGVFVHFRGLPPHEKTQIMVIADADVCEEHKQELREHPEMLLGESTFLDIISLLKVRGVRIDVDNIELAFPPIAEAEEKRDQLDMMQKLRHERGESEDIEIETEEMEETEETKPKKENVQ